MDNDSKVFQALKNADDVVKLWIDLHAPYKLTDYNNIFMHISSKFQELRFRPTNRHQTENIGPGLGAVQYKNAI